MEGKKILVLIGVILAVLTVLVVFFFFWLRRGGPVTLTYWGLWEPEAVYNQVIADYQRSHPNVTIKYQKQSPISYRDRLTGAIASESGPDIIRIHNSWLPMLKNSLAAAPESTYSFSAFKNTFYPVHSQDLIFQNKVYALPLEIDTLGLYINEDIFRNGGAEIPTDWDEFLAAARKLTVRDSSGRIKTAGAAMGTASNVDHWPEILALMMLQAGVDLNTQVDSDDAAQALGFYSAFATGEKIWDETLDNSTLAFANGQLAMYFGPSWRFFDIQAVSPDLNFRVLPVPQLTGGSPVNYASYWAEAVSKKSRNPAVAWDFLKYLSSKEVLTKIYSAQSQLRSFGEPYPRKDMAPLLTPDSPVGLFVAAVPTAQSWYLASATADGDTGINSRLNNYFADAINSMLRGSDARSVLATVQQGISQVLEQY